MRKYIIAATAALSLAGVATSFGDPVRVDDPTGGSFSDGTNAGYVEVDTNGAVRACNENPSTPAGDSLTGYVWVNANGNEDTPPTYSVPGTGGYAGAGDDDGDGQDKGNDCP